MSKVINWGGFLMNSWELFKEVLDILYQISGIALVSGVFFAVQQLRVLKKDMNDRNLRAATEASMSYLAYFQSKIVPLESEYSKKVKRELSEPTKFDHLINDEFILKSQLSKELVKDSIVKQRCGVIPLLNGIEFFSTAVQSRLTDEDLLFTPLSHVFCDIVKAEYVWIAGIRTEGAAQYNNIVWLYNKWSKRMEVDKSKLQMAEAEHKIKEQGNNYHGSPPIGL